MQVPKIFVGILIFVTKHSLEHYSRVQSTVPSPDTMAGPARDVFHTDVGAIADHGDAIITWEDDLSVRYADQFNHQKKNNSSDCTIASRSNASSSHEYS